MTELELTINTISDEQLPAALVLIAARMAKPKPSVATDNELLDSTITAEELAARLSIPLSQVRSMTKRGELPHRKFGKYIRYSLAEVLAKQRA